MCLTENSRRKEYNERLKKAFPRELRKEIETVVEILPLNNHKIKLVDGEIHKIDNLIHPSEYEVNLNSEKLIIPYRLYFDEPQETNENDLTKIEKEILNSIYLRHHNGYLRERRLKKLLSSKNKFVVPFTIQLLGEYVFEILEVLEKHLNKSNLELYKSFIKENPKYWQKTESRMISYWNVYYRREYRKLTDYLGYELIQRIK